MTRCCWIIIALVLAVAVAAGAAAEADSASDASVADLAWLAGCWVSEEGLGAVEECWLTPRGGVMLGVNREVRGERAAFEFLRLSAESGTVTYWASPGGREPTPFELVEVATGRAVFANPEHDFPQRLSYREQDGRLHVRAEAEVDGAPRSIAWVWVRRAAGWGEP